MIECKFSLELTKNGIQKSINAKAGENQARKLIITLTESGNVFELSELNARVFFEDQTYSDDVYVVGNTVEFVLPAGLTSMAGIRMCELKIYRDAQVIYSPMFEVIIEESLGNTASAEPIGGMVQHQELIANTQTKDSEMTDEDFVVVYDTTTGLVMRLPWGKVKEMLVVTKHSVLEERDAENQHPIDAITGLRNELDSNATSISNVEQELSENISVLEQDNQTRYDELNKYIINSEDGLWAAIADVEARIHNHNNFSTLNALSRNGSILLFEGNEIGGTDGKTAYESAVEGGYAGTEEEFAAMLAKVHEHSNKDVLDLFGINAAGTLPTFDGKTLESTEGCAKRYAELNQILNSDYYNKAAVDEKFSSASSGSIKSVYCDNTWTNGLIVKDSTAGSNIDFYVYDGLIDFSAVAVIDIGVIWNGTEYRLSQLAHGEVLLVNSDSIPVVFGRPALDSSQGALNVARIIGATGGDFGNNPDMAEGYNIYYL